MKASGLSSQAAGNLYPRGRSGSCFRRPARASGAIAYIRTVADVIRPTRPNQSGNGRNVSMPITKQTPIDTSGTPRALILLMIFGK
jgi:hypothetical protein